ncbi:hypothetical protein COT72_04575 [archaeon CG10_big_fil_rev_8_21_14_0_10_43_11]|nr:MAG: hypothetical protein COT72_04575 [archaeon CG10_big_fil_rev_8_21_14_0_10_43_11]
MLDTVFLLKRFMYSSEDVLKKELLDLRESVLGKQVIETETIEFVDYASKLPQELEKKLVLDFPSKEDYIPRPIDEEVDSWFGEWNEKRSGSFAIVGGRGVGKTAFLKHHAQKGTLLMHLERMSDERELIYAFSKALKLQCSSISQLITKLNKKKRAIFIDDCHLLFLRKIGGFDLIKTLFYLIEVTQKNVLWVTTWDKYSYYYLNEVLKLSLLFSKVKVIPGMGERELKFLITRVFESTGLAIRISASREYAKTHRVVNAKKLESELWAQIAKVSEGNPLAALQYVKHSVMYDKKRVTLQNVRALDMDDLLSDAEDRIFAVSTILFHSALSAQDFAVIMGLERVEAKIILNDLHFKRIIIKEGNYYRAPIIILPLLEGVLKKYNILTENV